MLDTILFIILFFFSAICVAVFLTILVALFLYVAWVWKNYRENK